MRLGDQGKFSVDSGESDNWFRDESIPDEVESLQSIVRNGSGLEIGDFLVSRCCGCEMSAKSLMWLRTKLHRPMNWRTWPRLFGGGMSRSS